MTFIQIINLWSDHTPLSLFIWFIMVVTLFYFAKNQVHLLIRSFCRLLHDGFVQISSSVMAAEVKLKNRNKEVLLSAGADEVESQITREFYRVNTIVERDLSGFPALKRQLLEQIAKIEEDYQQSSNIPPTPPEWIESVEVLAKLPNEVGSHKTTANILKEIHKGTVNQQKIAMAEYRKAMSDHHSDLNRLMPYWRKLTNTLDSVGKTITGLQERSVKIDSQMDEFEEIVAKSDKAERTLSSSSMTQFFISGLILAIAVAGAIINFNLIALPMSEMVGGGSRIGSFNTSDVAALVIILVEVAMGLYLMESLRFTRLFPVIGQMDDRMRTRMMWITFSILVILAGIESSLALMRDQIAANNQALTQILAGKDAVRASASIIPTIGQMVLGFILPFILTFVAIPLESFIHSTRTVFGAMLILLLNAVSFLFNLIGKIIINFGEFLISLYDVIIFPPLWVESTLLSRMKKTEKEEIDDSETENEKMSDLIEARS